MFKIPNKLISTKNELKILPKPIALCEHILKKKFRKLAVRFGF